VKRPAQEWNDERAAQPGRRRGSGGPPLVNVPIPGGIRPRGYVPGVLLRSAAGTGHAAARRAPGGRGVEEEIPAEIKAFEPEPEVLRAACAGIETGHAIRMVLRFRRPVWEDREEFARLGFLFSTESWMPTWWTTLPVRSPVITAGWPARAPRSAKIASLPISLRKH